MKKLDIFILVGFGFIIVASILIVFLDSNTAQCPNNNCYRAYVLDQTDK